jgi:hypothetical protein
METETPTAPETTDTGDDTPSLDMASAVDQIGADLFPAPMETEDVTLDVVEPTPIAAAPVVPAPVVHEVPKSWAKDYHESWGKVDPKVQEYIKKRETDFLNGIEQYKGAAQYGKSMQDVVTPYLPLIQAKGLDAPRAVADMLSAYAELTQGSLEQRQAAYAKVGQHFGLALQSATNGSASQAPVDPRLQSLEQQFQQIQQSLTAQQQTALNAARTKAGQEVEAFASDPKNVLFDDVHEDIVRFIQMGDSLQDAYDKAVWANPVTREKQVQARLSTEAEKAKERARLDALPKLRAKSVNVQSRETQRAPTEPLGSMEETLKATAKAIKSRATH